jgi:hypothetical protein
MADVDPESRRDADAASELPLVSLFRFGEFSFDSFPDIVNPSPWMALVFGSLGCESWAAGLTALIPELELDSSSPRFALAT